jgi:hypothetical protein
MRWLPLRAVKPGSTRLGLCWALVLAPGLACGDQIVGHFDASSAGGDGSGGDTTATTQFHGSASTLAPSDDGSSSAAPAAPEVCDGVDNDLDGLVDEVAPGVDTCDGCRLLQGAGQAWWVCEALLTWDEAQARCEGLGASAAIVPSVLAQTFLQQQVAAGVHFYWLGSRQAEGEGAWAWVDGTAWGYTNWGTTQPDDVAPGQDCLRVTFGIEGEGWFHGAWDDFRCDDPHPWMCSAPHAAQ